MSYRAGLAFGDVHKEPTVYCDEDGCHAFGTVTQGRNGPKVPAGWKTVSDVLRRRDYCPLHARPHKKRRTK